jgi:hypothetical protein
MEAPDAQPHAPALTHTERTEAEAHRLYEEPLLTADQRKAERKRAFVDLHAEGLTYSECAAALNLDRSTAYRWRREDPEFAQACATAFKTSIERLEQHVEKRAFQNDKVAMWLLERRAPDKYNISQKVEHSGGVSLQVMTGVPTPGEDLV